MTKAKKSFIIMFLLVIIYMAFISLGLPDSLLGVSWPVMQSDMNVPISSAGFVSIVISGCTIISSLFSGKLLRTFGTGRLTVISVAMTAAAILGVAFSHSFMWLMLMAVPMGLGAGAVDASLNNYVAAHYSASHMNWLHCFWGVGAMTGPIIMSRFLQNSSNNWRGGYFTVAMVQFSLMAVLIVTLPLWKKAAALAHGGAHAQNAEQPARGKDLFRLRGVRLSMLAFLLYCGIEATMGLWGGSFLINIKGLDVPTAAAVVSTFYLGITAGRFACGFETLRVSNKMMVRVGELVILCGVLLLILPLPQVFTVGGMLLAGVGCAPVYPCMMHETPVRFGKENAESIMGFQMALAYTGSTFIPPLLGFCASFTTIGIFPFVILAFALLLFFLSERLNTALSGKKQ